MHLVQKFQIRFFFPVRVSIEHFTFKEGDPIHQIVLSVFRLNHDSAKKPKELLNLFFLILERGVSLSTVFFFSVRVSLASSTLVQDASINYFFCYLTQNFDRFKNL